MPRPSLRFTLGLLCIVSRATPAQRVHSLTPAPSTVAFGYYDAAAVPVLRVQSGDDVIVGTLITSSPTRLEQVGVKPADVQASLRAIYDSVKNSGPGGHILTGTDLRGRRGLGDVLEVRIRSIDLAIPYAYNGFGPKRGFLPEDFDYARTKIIPLDKDEERRALRAEHRHPAAAVLRQHRRRTAGIDGPSEQRPAGNPRRQSRQQRAVAGTTLYIPVWTKGALLEIGDGHAGQGNGEVDITALETSLTGRFKLIVRKDLHLTMPRAETPTHWITMGIDSSLVTATKQAVRQAIDFLMTTKGFRRTMPTCSRASPATWTSRSSSMERSASM